MIKCILILSFKKRKFTFSMSETSDDKSVWALPNSIQYLLLFSWWQEQTPHRHSCSPLRTLQVLLHPYSPNHSISSVTQTFRI